MAGSVEEWLGAYLNDKGWRIATAESCTGGLIASRITDVSGSSAYFEQGFITYSNEAKMALLGVSKDIAGPTGGSAEKPVGTVYMAVATSFGTTCRHYVFEGSRLEVKAQTAQAALDMVRDALEASG